VIEKPSTLLSLFCIVKLSVVLAGDLARKSRTLPGTIEGANFMLSRLRLVDFLGESVFSAGLLPVFANRFVLGLEYDMTTTILTILTTTKLWPASHTIIEAT